MILFLLICESGRPLVGHCTYPKQAVLLTEANNNDSGLFPDVTEAPAIGLGVKSMAFASAQIFARDDPYVAILHSSAVAIGVDFVPIGRQDADAHKVLAGRCNFHRFARDVHCFEREPRSFRKGCGLKRNIKQRIYRRFQKSSEEHPTRSICRYAHVCVRKPKRIQGLHTIKGLLGCSLATHSLATGLSAQRWPLGGFALSKRNHSSVSPETFRASVIPALAS